MTESERRTAEPISPGPVSAVGGAEHFTSEYLMVALAILFMVNVVNYTDRMVLSVLIEPIKAEFTLSDTQIGFLTGFAFAIFYAIAGVALARRADRTNRVKLISVLLVTWSAMTALTAAAQNFWHLFAARIGVGVGEAGVIPTSNAVITDYFPIDRRSGPLAVFTAGATVGITVGMALGGWVGDHYGWRWAFVIAGVPGLLLAVVVRSVLREPPKGHSDGVVHEADRSSLLQVLAGLARNRTFVYMVIGACFTNFLLFGVTNWMPPYLVRRFGMSLTEVGAFFGAALGLGGAAGAVLGGFAANRLAKRDLNWLVWIPAASMIVMFPLYELAVFAPSPWVAIWLVFAVNVVGGAAFGPVVAAILSVVRAENWATGSSVYGFAVSIIGIGAAPLVVGMLSDALSPRFGSAVALQYALALAIPFALVAAVCYGLATRTFKEAVAANG